MRQWTVAVEVSLIVQNVTEWVIIVSIPDKYKTVMSFGHVNSNSNK